MIVLQNHIICEQIHENNRIKVFKGYTARDKMPVIIKCLKKEAADPVGISRLIHEYEIARSLNIEGVIKPVSLEQTGSQYALVMKDIGAVSFRKYIQSNSIDLLQFLRIAAQLTEILGQLHQNHIIHRDLKPENIVINPSTGKLYIIDFSSSAILSEENRNKLFTENPVGTFEYMPPEQTGLLNNIGIDERSDLYSLGIIFYEIITGRLPLQAGNPAGWVYAHTTQKIQPPDKVNPEIPHVISDIIMKLLMKDADERYQSAYGLLWDLKECERMLVQTEKIEHFSIGQADISALFKLPQKLYGREKESEVIKDAFERVCEGGTETILVSGYPGVGKTMLMIESLKSITLEKGYFITGKFDQLRHNIPYAPFAAAFGSLIKQLMTESRGELERWKKRILRNLGRNGAVVTNIIPELELLIGKQEPVDLLPPKEAENRFLMVFRDFIRVFAWKGHPLVLFLDDLQWADAACIRLFEYLIRNANLHSILFIGAFRENEVDENRPLAEMLEGTEMSQSCKKHISLLPLERDAVEEIVAETLHTEPKKVTALSEVLYRKSGGNPFFLGQLLKLIHNEEHLYFNKKKGCWNWNLEAIQKLEPGEDVLELLMRKLNNFPEETIEIMKLAACMGNKFDLDTLATVCGKSLEETASCLMPATLEGLILITENQELNLPSTYPEVKPTVFEFLHDRVQQAVYSLIKDDEKKEKHFAIGCLILQKSACDGLEDKILSIMDHFNRSLELIRDPAERVKLAEYNLLAGRKAKASAAYVSALQYFRSGIALLPNDAWKRTYTLSFDLHLELAQAEFISANTKVAEELFDLVIEKAGDELERASVYGLKVILYAGMGKYDEAVHTGIQALMNLGIKLPLHPSFVDYTKELLLYKWYMRGKKIEELIDLPEMKDPVQKKIAELLTRLSSVTIHSHPDLFGLIILKAGNQAVGYGHTEMSSIGYFGYSFTTGSVLGDYKAGEKFGEVGIQLAERYGLSHSKCIMYFVLGAFVVHWTRHVSCALGYFKKAVLNGVEAGDALIIGYAHCLHMEIKFLMGFSLEKVSEEIRKKLKIAERLKHESLTVNAEIYDWVTSILTGQKTASLSSGAEDFKKESIPHLKQSDKSSLATFYLHKMRLCYLAGNYREALYAAKNGLPFMESILGFMTSAEFNFYYSLTITALYEKMSSKEKRYYCKVLKKNQKKMKKWSVSCKENFQHKFFLVDAEIMCLKNKKEDAMILYDKAIRLARNNGYIQDEALANELAAKFYLRLGLEKVAKTYMLDAFRGYSRWGATAKVRELLDRYPELLDGMGYEMQKDNPVEATKTLPSISMPSDNETASVLDRYFIDRAIEKISRETDISRLLESFLNIGIESIGADRGYLILEKDGELFIEAVKDSNSSAEVVEAIPLEESHKLSKAVIRYVARTLETVVLNCDEKTGIFASDPYIAEGNPKSIACMPLLFQGIQFGVFYFENNFIPGIFAPERLEVLKLLSAQIAYVKRIQEYLENDNAGVEKRGHGDIIEPLTERETEVLNLIAEGMSNKEIANKLEITLNTVKGYIKNIYDKLGVNRRVQVVNRAKQLKLLK